ncbi:PAS domain S-box protein [Fictibacillus nanhaiensis]|uniref:PAS domain S-box protein n=1 Tax=Fictibacillus nanhaiensis TaxID=742169 RepID=UPI001C94B2C4|nr:PAS domain S-box protein [Fictibacillus nanhaiensis]MBY6035036.1 PAS domain S-box protein [Fictibacillus nanhaiensis]
MEETSFEIKENKEIMDMFYEAVSSGVIVLQRSNQILHANKKACEILGLSKAELEDHFLYDMPFEVINQKRDELPFDQLPSQITFQTGNEVIGCELSIIHPKDKELRWILASTKPIFHSGNVINQVVITLVDITNRKETEQALSRSQERFRSLVDSMEDTVFTLDHQLAHTGIYGKWMEKHNVKPEHFLGKTVREVFGDQIAEGQEKACEIVFQGKSQLYEWSNMRNGERLYYQAILSPIKNEQGQVEGIVGVSRDITQNKKMEIGLRESEERFRQFAENAKDVFWMKDFETRKLLYVSKAYEKIWGVQPSVFTSVFSNVHPEDCMNVKEFIHSITCKESQIEYRIQTNNKKVRWIRTRAFPITNDHGDIYRIAGITEDITELKEKEELLRKSDKLTVVGELAAGIAHEIRNPLTSIKGFVQLMKNDMDDLHSEIILSEMDRIESIITEFLVLAKPHQDTVFQQRNVNDFIGQTITLLDSEANLNNVQFDTYLRDVPQILCEGNQIKQVIINVIKNAIESMMNGGTISVETGTYDEGYVYIKVTDQGSGISEERLARLGEPFYSNKEKGIGLGLMVSLKIIENHHGNITFESIVDVGTTVTILLPTKLLP